jgi:apolipoprotein N-acyltransferase
MKQFVKDRYKPLIWFLVGFGAFIFTRVGNYVSFTLPFAAIFILRFSRSQKPWTSILLMSLGFPLAGMASQMSFHGSGFEIVFQFLQLTIKGLIFMVPYAFDRLLHTKVTGFKGTFVFPVSAITVYFLNSTFGLFQGTAHFYAFMQYGNLPLMQLLSIAGIWGLGFFLLWISSFVNWVWESALRWSEIKKGVVVFVSVTLMILTYGGLRASPLLYSYDGQTVNVATVLYDDHTPDDVVAMFKNREFSDLNETVLIIENRVRQAAEAGADIIALQEYGILIPQELEGLLVEQMKQIARENSVYLCVNYLYLPPMQQQSYDYTFGFIELPDEEEGRNIALLISDKGDVEIEYVKRHLPMLEGNYILNSESDQFPVVDTPYGRIGVVICKDMEFSRFMRQAGQSGADIIIAPSSEAARALAITYSQMLRSVEYGFSFIRPTNHGMSVAVDFRGNILSSMNSFTTPLETMYAHVPIKGISTFYSRIGDLFAWLCCIAFLGILAYGIKSSFLENGKQDI